VLQVNGRFFSFVSPTLSNCQNPFSGSDQRPEYQGNKQDKEYCGEHFELQKRFFRFSFIQMPTSYPTSIICVKVIVWISYTYKVQLSILIFAIRNGNITSST
jgi:hypothetical protein